MKLPTNYLTLFILCSIGFLIRIYNLGFQAMNYDEIFTISFASTSLTIQQLIIQSLSTDFTPPLYYISAHLSMLVFGETATAIRIPSAIFGVLLIPVMYLIGKEYRDELFGLLLAGVTTFFYTFIYYSRYGRSYSLELLLFAIAFLFFMKYVYGNDDARYGFAIFASLTMWTHLYSVIPIAIMVAYILWNCRLDILDFIWFGIVVGCCIPLLNYIPVILSTRQLATNAFGATPLEILIVTPFDLFAYSTLVVVPIIMWSMWKNRTDKLLQIIFVISIISWISMFAISFVTPVILHYLLYLVVMLMLAFVLPFYQMILKKHIPLQYLYCIGIIGLMEALQICFAWTTQR